MSYLITKDYLRVIQYNELNAITSNDVSIRKLVEGSVQTEMKASLMQKFDLDSEFKDLNAFLLASTQKGGYRVYLDATAYNASATYALNALVLQTGNVYYCSTAITTPEAFNIAKWTLLGAQYDFFYVNLPAELFNQDKFYQKGDLVFWKDKVYQAQTDSCVIDQQDALQAPSIESIRRGNRTPDEFYWGSKMWGTGVAFSFANLFVTNPAQTAWSSLTTYTVGQKVSFGGKNYVAVDSSLDVEPGTDFRKWLPVVWVSGDNRNQMFVEMMLDMVVYSLCKRIAPNNVPEARHNAWVKTTKNLKAMANGEINAQLPVIQPTQGNRIRWGGQPKQINNW